jgi:hypothetical protein
MEFLASSLTNDSSLFLRAIHSPFFWRILKKKTYSSLVLKILAKKSAKQENSSLFMNSTLQNRKMMAENQTKTRV